MAKISINLLPPEIITQSAKKAKFYKIQAAGIAIILILVFLSSLTVAMRILQSRNIAVVQAKLTEEEQRISDMKTKEASLFLLKNRLSVIEQYLGVPSKESATYTLISGLIPSSIGVNSLSINKSGEAILMASVPDYISLDNLINNFTMKENNEGKISELSIESLSRGRDGLYRISFKVMVN